VTGEKDMPTQEELREKMKAVSPEIGACGIS
jgi:hypothetical protein